LFKKMASINKVVTVKTKCLTAKTLSVLTDFPFTFLTPFAITSCKYLNQNCSSSSLATQPEGSGKAELISKAMKAYLDRARAHGKLMTDETAEFEFGKQHLARIMGKDPDNFDQADIDKAVRYLFPSGLFAPPARPFMKHPYQVFPKKKNVQFGWDGRPFHPFFYTGRPMFNKILYDGIEVLDMLTASPKPLKKDNEDIKAAREKMTNFLAATKLITLEDLKTRLLEKINDKDYERFVALMERIMEHPNCYLAKDFLSSYRESVGDLLHMREIKEPAIDENGVRYALGEGSRKCSKAEIILREGTGVISINGQDLDRFEQVQDRLQILTPFAFLGRVGEFDVEADVQGPSNARSSSTGAIRLGIARALCSFSTPTEVEQMRLAGLLTQDPRVRERKLPGQSGARAKFTWKRR